MITVFINIVGQVFLHEDGFELHEEPHGSRPHNKLGNKCTQHTTTSSTREDTSTRKDTGRGEKARQGKARQEHVTTGQDMPRQYKAKARQRQRQDNLWLWKMLVQEVIPV